MKRFQLIGTLIIALCLSITAFAHAADVVLDTSVEAVKTAIDKRGNEYTRVIVNVEKELSGVKYSTGVPLMAFGQAQSALVKDLKNGDKIKVIASHRTDSRGRESYTLIKKLQ